MTDPTSRTLTAAFVLIAGGALAACGDDDKPSAAEYRTEVNAICTAGNERLNALFADSPLGPDATEAQLVEVLDQILAEINGQLDDIDALDTPGGDLSADVDAWLAESRATVAEVRSSGAAFFEQQATGVNPFADVNAKAVELGFDACGE